MHRTLTRLCIWHTFLFHLIGQHTPTLWITSTRKDLFRIYFMYSKNHSLIIYKSWFLQRTIKIITHCNHPCEITCHSIWLVLCNNDGNSQASFGGEIIPHAGTRPCCSDIFILTMARRVHKRYCQKLSVWQMKMNGRIWIEGDILFRIRHSVFGNATATLTTTWQPREMDID